MLRRAVIVAWFRPMGRDEVEYHEATVVGRKDDHPGAALAYYGSRGETPLRWGGAGAARLGLAGDVNPQAYEAAFGPGGFRHPSTGERLVATKRPGFELVVSAHKSVAVLGVVGRSEDMHSILDVETAATMDKLDGWFQERGGRRGRGQTRTATSGLTYATTRHATSRAGDPSPHDHVLVANVVEMLDCGDHKGLDSAALRDTVEAATMVGRLHSAARAVELGFQIETDDGPSGNLRHWRIVGVPDAICEVFSKRSDEIAEHLATTGHSSYRARGIAARASRAVKRHTGVDELLPQWQAELEAVGWPVERLTAHLNESAPGARSLPFPMTTDEIDALAADVLDIEGRLLSHHKAFTLTHLTSEVAPRLYGRDPAELDRVLGRITAGVEVVPLIGVAGAREQAYTTVEVLVAEQTISRVVETLAERPGPALEQRVIAAAIASAEHDRGHCLSGGQRGAVHRLCGSGRSASIVVGVAGSGKTTALDTATRALESAGYRVLGTSTSGQAARTLGTEAHLEARTFKSLLWRLDHGQIALDDRTVVMVDEAGMADDADLARLALAVERSGASLVLVGDHRQLAAVGPGGALGALIRRRPDIAVTLDDNVRQRDPAERAALAELRDRKVPRAVGWYAETGRIHTEPSRAETLAAMADAWAGDHDKDRDTALLAWRRIDVSDLNRLARDRWDQLGQLRGDDVQVNGGRWYTAGDRLVALAPNHEAGIVTSEPLVVLDVVEDAMRVFTADGSVATITGEGLDTEHLDYGYALTVHRAQGATYDCTHVLAAGGGRELGYVALSRARDRTTIHATADDLDQAVEDLQADWGVARHQRWITDTSARPGLDPEPSRPVETTPAAQIPRTRTLAERHQDARQRIDALERDHSALCAGTGRWHDTPEGAAARQLNDAHERLHNAERLARNPGTHRRDRRTARKSISGLSAATHAAQDRWEQIGQPVADQLLVDVDTAEKALTQLRAEATTARLDRLQSGGAHRPGDIAPEISQ